MSEFPLWVQAGFWGLIGGSALVIGAFFGIQFNLPQRLIAGIMAFGSGVLFSALSFELVDEAFKKGGLLPTLLGFALGSGLYTFANWVLSQKGAKHRKRSGYNSKEHQPSEREDAGSGMAMAIGALLDGIPESIVIGIGLVGGEKVSLVTVLAIFLSNIPEGLSSASGMKKAGRSRFHILMIWGAIAVICALASILGYSLLSQVSLEVIAVITALAAGGILTMIVDTMIPEAFEETHSFAGLITVLGFLSAFFISKLGH